MGDRRLPSTEAPDRTAENGRPTDDIYPITDLDDWDESWLEDTESEYNDPDQVSRHGERQCYDGEDAGLYILNGQWLPRGHVSVGVTLSIEGQYTTWRWP